MVDTTWVEKVDERCEEKCDVRHRLKYSSRARNQDGDSISGVPATAVAEPSRMKFKILNFVTEFYWSTMYRDLTRVRRSEFTM